MDFSAKWSCSFISLRISLPPKILHEQVKGLDLGKKDRNGANMYIFCLKVIFADEIAKGCNWPRQAFAKEKNIHTRGWEATLHPNPANQMLLKSKWEVLSLLFHVKRSIADYLIIAVLI